MDEDLPMPPLFQFLTVLAFKIFVSEKVRIANVLLRLDGNMHDIKHYMVKEEIYVCIFCSVGHLENLK